MSIAEEGRNLWRHLAIIRLNTLTLRGRSWPAPEILQHLRNFKIKTSLHALCLFNVNAGVCCLLGTNCIYLTDAKATYRCWRLPGNSQPSTSNASCRSSSQRHKACILKQMVLEKVRPDYGAYCTHYISSVMGRTMRWML